MTRPRLPSLSAILRVGIQAARAGGRRSLETFGGRLRPEVKPDGSPVTAADRAAEAEIRRTLRRAFPDHTIVGEEGGVSAGDPRVRWIVDPIDGTQSYIRGVPFYATLVAAEIDRRPSVGVIHLPALGETIAAARGLGCTWNGRRAHVSRVTRPAEATVLATSFRGVENRGVPFSRVVEGFQVERTWGDAYGYALVATGRAEVMLDTGMHLWDCAPLLPILEEAGGRFTDWQGVRTIAEPDVLGTNGRLHAAMLERLAPGGRAPARRGAVRRA